MFCEEFLDFSLDTSSLCHCVIISLKYVIVLLMLLNLPFFINYVISCASTNSLIKLKILCASTLQSKGFSNFFLGGEERQWPFLPYFNPPPPLESTSDA